VFKEAPPASQCIVCVLEGIGVPVVLEQKTTILWK
jgi:hypothetical protein